MSVYCCGTEYEEDSNDAKPKRKEENGENTGIKSKGILFFYVDIYSNSQRLQKKKTNPIELKKFFRVCQHSETFKMKVSF